MGRLRSWLVTGMIGAALAYFLDPNTGAHRRNTTRDRLGHFMRRFGRRSQKLARFAGGRAYGILQETVPHRRDNPNPDDNTLRDRVGSQIFRDPGIPKGQFNINVVDGMVELHGQLNSQAEIDNVIRAVQKVTDVKNVRSYLHLPGTPAPDKASAINAS